MTFIVVGKRKNYLRYLSWITCLTFEDLIKLSSAHWSVISDYLFLREFEGNKLMSVISRNYMLSNVRLGEEARKLVILPSVLLC